MGGNDKSDYDAYMHQGQAVQIIGSEPTVVTFRCVLCGEEHACDAGDQVMIYSNGHEEYLGCVPCVEGMTALHRRIRANATRQDNPFYDV